MYKEKKRRLVFMKMAEILSSLSSCVRPKKAAILVRENMIISTGYNGTPKGVLNCDEGGCDRCNNDPEHGKDLDKCICVHAEENAIIQAAYNGISTKDSTLFSTHKPCWTCLKTLMNAGIRRVYFVHEYGNEDYPKQLTMGPNTISLEKLDDVYSD
jgi:dCMP deaminase